VSNSVIRVERLGKEYRLGERAEADRTLRDTIAGAFRAGRRRTPRESIWALRDIDLNISTGEIVGVIGRNGAGKSTLLKILARITTPTTGRAEIRGRVGALLEVGTGFHQELTGRENVFLNGAILGMRRREIERKFEEIVAFAEVEPFVDTPVKHYSSGMYLRLAFAVAAHLESEILLVDEVLAVGDVGFQRKCLGKMGEIAHGGRTVLFVSHNLGAVTGLCNRGIWIDGGRVAGDGDVEEVTEAYFRTFAEGHFQFRDPAHGFAIDKVVLRGGSGEAAASFRPGEDLAVEITYRCERPLEAPAFALVVQGVRGPCFAANMRLDGRGPRVLEGEGRLTCVFRSIPLLPQSYSVQMAIRASNLDAILDLQEVASFSVTGDLGEHGFRGNYQSLAHKSVPVMIPYEWVLPDGSVEAVDLSSGAPAPRPGRVEAG
jgi:lipopolysaccharide transport system ATP-binding protein